MVSTSEMFQIKGMTLLTTAVAVKQNDSRSPAHALIVLFTDLGKALQSVYQGPPNLVSEKEKKGKDETSVLQVKRK